MLGFNSKREPIKGEYAEDVRIRKYGTMPCVFSEDEMDTEIRLSELSGTMTHGEVLEDLRRRTRHENRVV